MKVVEARAIPLQSKLPKPFHGGTYTIESRCTTVVSLRTDTGIEGVIWGGDEKELGGQLADFINGELRGRIVGEDPRFVGQLWAKMADTLQRLQGCNPDEVRERHLRLEAIALVDMGLWDLIGRVHGAPLYKLLGAYCDRLPIIAIGGYYQEGKGLDALVAEVQDYVDRGYGGIKLKVGSLEPEEDLQRLDAVLSSAPEEFLVACDVNMGWSLPQAIRFVRAVEKQGLRIAWLEEPIEYRHQYEGMRRLRQLTSIPICSGQNETIATGCMRLLQEECVDVINYDVTVCGGITEWRKIAAASQLWPNIRIGHHEEALVAMHLLASIPNGFCAECFPDPNRDPLWESLPAEPPVIRDGLVHLPEAHGLGMDVNWDVVDRWRVDGG